MGKGILLTIAVMLVSATALLGSQGQGLPTSATNLGSVTGGDFKKAHQVINNKCNSCHSTSLIERARMSGKDMAAIQKRMEQKGAKLSQNDREVLGIYWKQNPLKDKK